MSWTYLMTSWSCCHFECPSATEVRGPWCSINIAHKMSSCWTKNSFYVITSSTVVSIVFSAWRSIDGTWFHFVSTLFGDPYWSEWIIWSNGLIFAKWCGGRRKSGLLIRTLSWWTQWQYNVMMISFESMTAQMYGPREKYWPVTITHA